MEKTRNLKNYKRYITTKDIWATETFCIPKGCEVWVNWSHYDGASWKCFSSSNEEKSGCPWTNTKDIELKFNCDKCQDTGNASRTGGFFPCDCNEVEQ